MTTKTKKIRVHTPWARMRSCEWQIVVRGTTYRLTKNRRDGGWFLYEEQTSAHEISGFRWELKYEREWIGFFSEGFGTRLTDAKKNALNYLVDGIGIDDERWII